MKKILICSLFLVLSLSGCGLSTSSPANNPPKAAEARSIDIKNSIFMPGTMNLSVGDTVTWTNQDAVQHSIKSDTFNSTPLNPGGTFQYKFDKAGTFNYTCGLHPTMQGTIIVK